jgi:riboflavin synthase
MFTGLIEGVGRIARCAEGTAETRLRIEPAQAWAGQVTRGESIAVDGACLTATEPDSQGFWVDVSRETLACTTLGERATGAAVNLERALLPTTRLGGHLVAGHVDGVAEITEWREDGASWRLRVALPAELAGFVAAKGSICVDGISLTVNDIDEADFGVNIIPHTLVVTTLSERQVGDCVNIEVDVIARYVARLMQYPSTRA